MYVALLSDRNQCGLVPLCVCCTQRVRDSITNSNLLFSILMNSVVSNEPYQQLSPDDRIFIICTS